MEGEVLVTQFNNKDSKLALAKFAKNKLKAFFNESFNKSEEEKVEGR